MCCDFAFGISVAVLAKRECVSTSRAYQIVTTELRQIGLTPAKARQDPDELLRRLRDDRPMRVWKDEAETPEEFFAEVFYERRTITS